MCITHLGMMNLSAKRTAVYVLLDDIVVIALKSAFENQLIAALSATEDGNNKHEKKHNYSEVELPKTCCTSSISFLARVVIT